jgi:hypothetical protein
MVATTPGADARLHALRGHDVSITAFLGAG